MPVISHEETRDRFFFPPILPLRRAMQTRHRLLLANRASLVANENKRQLVDSDNLTFIRHALRDDKRGVGDPSRHSRSIDAALSSRQL